MILMSPGAVAFQIFGLSVYWYGIVMAFAILVGTFVANRAYKKIGGGELMLDLMPWLVIVGFLGARLYYCLLNGSYYLSKPLSMLNVREGGLSIHGAILACLIFLIFYVRKRKLSLFEITAPLALGLSLAQSIGRWGNFFNSEAFGKPIETGMIKLFIPEYLRPLQYRSAEYFHPAFLYESLLDFGIFLILLWAFRKNKNPLFLTSLYFVLYAIARILVESVRIDSIVNIAGIPVAIWVSILILAAGLCGVFKSRA